MANTITAHTIVNGTRNLIVQFNFVADGSGEYADFKFLDVLGYGAAPNDYKVAKVSGRNGDETSFKLLFGATVSDSKLFFESIPDEEFSQEWVGGISPLLVDSDMTLRITTSGFDAAGDTISLVVWIKKKIKSSGNS